MYFRGKYSYYFNFFIFQRFHKKVTPRNRNSVYFYSTKLPHFHNCWFVQNFDFSMINLKIKTQNVHTTFTICQSPE